MDLNRIINMIVNTFVRRAVNGAINTGIDYAARRGKAPEDMTPEERAQAQDAKKTAQRARKMQRATRRLF